MISIIICSRNADIPMSLKDNINETIGDDYELIVVDNSTNKHSIFSAYNEGVARSKGDILCFMHEDIEFVDRLWGQRVSEHFMNDSIGLIGVFGGHFLPKRVCHIGDSGFLSANYCFSDGKKSKLFALGDSWNKSGESDVVAVDGLWFCIRKELFDKISFDTKTYTGFHYYDMDISMQVWSAGYKCVVINDVLIEHRSRGVINQNFVYSAYNFYNKWKVVLPFMKGIEISKEMMDFSDQLCQYKNYSRELQVEIDMIKRSRWYRLGEYVKKIIK